jgi:hypothetical protein
VRADDSTGSFATAACTLKLLATDSIIKRGKHSRSFQVEQLRAAPCNKGP